METCTPHFRMKQNRKIGKVVLIKQTPQKKKEYMRFQILKNIVLSKHCPISSQKMTQTHHVSLTVVQSQLCLPQMLNLFGTPIKHYPFTQFMHDISKNAKCFTTYTAHCLRATAIQEMNDAGLELRHIMHMSGHKTKHLFAVIIATVQCNKRKK